MVIIILHRMCLWVWFP